mgnify:FL=1
MTNRSVVIRVYPEEVQNPQRIKAVLSQKLGSGIQSWQIVKKSIDARQKQIMVQLTVLVNAPAPEPFQWQFKDVHNAQKTCHIIGTGPAGLFAAIRCLELGIKPILIERGKEVRARRRDLAVLQRTGTVNPESNYCFGEGGAGTYSDGKLYTRSGNRNDIEYVLNQFIAHGAAPEIQIEAHPHIGTNKLPQVIEAIRNNLIAHGAEFHFQTQLVDFTLIQQSVRNIYVRQQHSTPMQWPVQRIILATGHSARDIYELFAQKQLLIESKPFALGFRIEHPQAFIDQHQYHCSEDQRDALRMHLPPASYQLVTQTQQAPVYSFCMCPGGIIAPCSTAPGEVVTNGWSPSKRNNPFANSGIVAAINSTHLKPYARYGAFAGLYFQREMEQRAFQMGGGQLRAPAQRAADFLLNKSSSTLPPCSYTPGVQSVNLNQLFPQELSWALKTALSAFDKKIKGFAGQEALLVATESRTSTPVRIPRDHVRGWHPQIHNLFPCGEGAGYAGGIVSAAMDGIKMANLAQHL